MNRPHVGLMAGLVTVVASLSGVGAAHASAFVSSTGLFVAVDPESVLTTKPISIQQQTPFSNVETELFHQSDRGGGAGSILRADALSSANFSGVSLQTSAFAERVGVPEQGTSNIAGFAQTGLHDALTITGTATSPQQVVLHRTVEISGRAAGNEFLEFNGDHIEGSTSFSLISNGINDLSLSPFLSFSFTSVNDVITTNGNDAFQRLVDFSILVDLNKSTDIDLALFNQFDFHLTDVDGTAPRGNFNLQGDVFGAARAAFLGGATVTDVAGNAVCGLTITADSGTDWGSIAACQGGGSGGGVGAGGVPEPASWALLIAGFGGLGAMLRRSRAANGLAATI